MLPYLSVAAFFLLAFASPSSAAERVLFEESFEDTSWADHGWYDGPQIRTTTEEKVTGNRSCVWHWEKEGDVLPSGKGGRVKLDPVDNITFTFKVKHSESWQWTGVRWHPHEFLFMTNVDPDGMGPAYTHLTFYVERVNGVPRLGIQDSRNIDEGRLGEDLVGVTEFRSVAGGNGDSDGHGTGNHYRAGEHYRNGKHWDPPGVFFADVWGDYLKTDWHELKTRIVLNTLKKRPPQVVQTGGDKGQVATNFVGQKDGIIQMWYDGVLIMEHRDVVFRTGEHPDLKIDKFLMLPYIGPGARGEQKIWIDDLLITTEE